MQTIHKVLTDFTSDRDQFNAPTLGISDVDREKMEAGGFYLDTGRKVEAWGGKNKIYVPTPEELEHMGSFRAQGSALDLSSGRVLPKHIATK
ncbi:hypothetical protein LRR18_18130, partial [Mangrovimonas sp. AS39]|uniref:hypothetical protein n=1 Tax=Mangrovimonas futianensis TaxID=2895523 RepID=UPI001E30BB4B